MAEDTILVVIAQRTVDHDAGCTGIHCCKCGHHVTVKEVNPDLATVPGVAEALPICEECMAYIEQEYPHRTRKVGVG
jgi:DNA-directed RNA polymerase subunit RPC12/RpoP